MGLCTRVGPERNIVAQRPARLHQVTGHGIPHDSQTEKSKFCQEEPPSYSEAMILASSQSLWNFTRQEAQDQQIRGLERGGRHVRQIFFMFDDVTANHTSQL